MNHEMIPLGEWKREAAKYFSEVTHAAPEKALEYAADLAKREYKDFATDPHEAVVHDLKRAGTL